MNWKSYEIVEQELKSDYSCTLLTQVVVVYILCMELLRMVVMQLDGWCRKLFQVFTDCVKTVQLEEKTALK